MKFLECMAKFIGYTVMSFLGIIIIGISAIEIGDMLTRDEGRN